VSEKEKKSTFCLDCCEEPESCGKNPLDCMKDPEARIYFQKYDEAAGWKNVS